MHKIDTGAEGNAIPVDIQTPVSTVKLQPRRCTAWTNSFEYNDYCLRGSHHTAIWHLWAAVSRHDHSNSNVFHVVNTADPKSLGFPTRCDMKLVTLNYCISTTQTKTAPMPNPQGNTGAKSELRFQYQNYSEEIGCRELDVSNHPIPMVPIVIHPRDLHLKHYVIALASQEGTWCTCPARHHGEAR